MASVMIVDAERLHETPVAFQQYIERYFREDKLLGKRVFVAARFLTLSRYQLGHAPRHSIEVDSFTEGLAKGQRLYDWMDKKGRNVYFWEFEGGHDSDNVYHVD